jgi:hypothetical protein
MLSMLGIVLSGLSISSACTSAFAQSRNHPWLSAEGIYIADKEAIHVVDTSSIYIDLPGFYIADTAALYIENPRNIHAVCQEIYISPQSTEEEKVRAYDMYLFKQHISNSSQERITNVQNRYLAHPISKIPDATVPTTAVIESASANKPLRRLPLDRPTKSKENACVAVNTAATSSSKSKINQHTLFAVIAPVRYGQRLPSFRYRLRISSYQSKTKYKEIYLISSVLRGPPIGHQVQLLKKGIRLDQVS